MRLPNWIKRCPSFEHMLIGYLVAAPTVAVCFGANTGATILGGVGAAAIVLTRLNDVSSFSLFGLRAQLRQAVREVEVTIEQLRSMATAFAEASLSELAATGHAITPITVATKFDIRNRIVDSLIEIGVSQEDVLKTQSAWRTIHCSYFLTLIGGKLITLAVSNAAFLTKQLPLDHDTGVPTPASLRELVAGLNLTGDAGLRDLLGEYELLWTTGSMKTPDTLSMLAG